MNTETEITSTKQPTVKALVIPAYGPVFEADVPAHGGQALSTLQGLVGGLIELVNVPQFIKGSDNATAYVNEEFLYARNCKPNMRATDFLVPGIGIDFELTIRGPLVLLGFDPRTTNYTELPKGVIDRVRLIEDEAGEMTDPDLEALAA